MDMLPIDVGYLRFCLTFLELVGVIYLKCVIEFLYL